MGVVIDVNTLPLVFNKRSSQHQEFRPVLDWMVKDKAKIIVGGSLYFSELQKMEAYLTHIKELSKVNKVHAEKNETVDVKEKEIRDKTSSKKLNDLHLVALIAVTNCKVFCSNDKRCFSSVRNREVSKFFKFRPKIYTNAEHAPRKEILCDSNLTPKCNPHSKLSKDQIKALSFY
ncbi:MAG: hypothetical protein ABR911_01720 [Syntrophales bacterium]